MSKDAKKLAAEAAQQAQENRLFSLINKLGNWHTANVGKEDIMSDEARAAIHQSGVLLVEFSGILHPLEEEIDKANKQLHDLEKLVKNHAAEVKELKEAHMKEKKQLSESSEKQLKELKKQLEEANKQIEKLNK